MTYDDFLDDPDRDEVFVVVVSPRDPATLAPVDLYLSDRPWRTAATDTPSRQRFEARLITGVNVTLPDLEIGKFGLTPEPGRGEIRIGQRDGDLDSWRTAYLWEGATVEMRHGGIARSGRLPYASWGVLLRAQVDHIEVGLDHIRLALRDGRERLAAPALQRRFRENGAGWWLLAGASFQTSFGTPSKLDLPGDVVIEWPWTLITSFGASHQNVFLWDGTTRPFFTRLEANGAVSFNATGYAAAIVTPAGRIAAARLCKVALVRLGQEISILIYDEATGAETLDQGTASTTASARVGGQLILSSTSFPITGFVGGDLRVWVPTGNLDTTLAQIRDRRDRMLTSAEAAGYVGVWKMTEGTGTAVADSGSGTAANGTITGTGTWTRSGEPSELSGHLKAMCWGIPASVPLSPVAPSVLIYQLSARGADAVGTVREGGAAITAGVTRGTLNAIYVNTPAAGTADIYIAADHLTLVRLGSAPTLPLFADVTAAGGSGSTRFVGELAAKILAEAGLSPLAASEIDSAAFTALTQAGCGVYVDDERSVQAVIDRVLAGGAAYWWQGFDGVFTAREFVGTTGAASFAIDERDLVSVEPVVVGGPVWEVIVRWGERHRTLILDQMAGTVRGTTLETAFSTRWREVRRTSSETLRRYPTTARRLVVETALAGNTTAEALADKLLALLGGAVAPPRGYRFRFRRDRTVEYLDIFAVTYHGEVERGEGKRVRLDLDATKFVAVGQTRVHAGPDKLLTVTGWRED